MQHPVWLEMSSSLSLLFLLVVVMVILSFGLFYFGRCYAARILAF